MMKQCMKKFQIYGKNCILKKVLRLDRPGGVDVPAGHVGVVGPGGIRQLAVTLGVPAVGDGEGARRVDPTVEERHARVAQRQGAQDRVADGAHELGALEREPGGVQDQGAQGPGVVVGPQGGDEPAGGVA